MKNNSRASLTGLNGQERLPQETSRQGRIKWGATGVIAPGPPLHGGPRDEIYSFQIK